ncbi:hypothetical protein BGW42_000806 [Actinomortierella wolfii]|nr:hypothetical protein BGW42_000806 [Actinomortierella wolfii]
MADIACIFTYVPTRLEIKLPVNGQLVLGRGAILDIKTVHMSRRQVEITSVDGRVYITRQGTNKSLLNGVELVKGRSTELKDGDSLTLLEKEYPVSVSIPGKRKATVPLASESKAAASPAKGHVNGADKVKASGNESITSGDQKLPKDTPTAAPAPQERRSSPVASVVVVEASAAAVSSDVVPARQDACQPVVDNEESSLNLVHQLQASVRKELQQQGILNGSSELAKADTGSTSPRHGPTTITGESEGGAEEQENDSSKSPSSSDDEDDLDSDGDKLRNNRRESMNRQKEADNNIDKHVDDFANGDDDDEAVMVEDCLSDESSFVCSDLSDLEAEQSDGHFEFAKIHKIKRQGRVEALD